MSITYVRHFEQASHRTTDPGLKQPLSQHHPPSHLIRAYDRIICSPYERCRASAQIWRQAAIDGDRVAIEVDSRTSEYHGGKKKKSGGFCLKKATFSCGVIAGPDETWDACARRLDKHWETMEQPMAAGKHILVVTHGIVVRYMQLKLEGKTSYARGRKVPYGSGFTFRLRAI